MNTYIKKNIIRKWVFFFATAPDRRDMYFYRVFVPRIPSNSAVLTKSASAEMNLHNDIAEQFLIKKPTNYLCVVAVSVAQTILCKC